MEQSYRDYLKEQFSILKDCDHNLLADVVKGLTSMGWISLGGSNTSVLLRKADAEIKVFRNPERPQMIMIRFTAPPEVDK